MHCGDVYQHIGRHTYTDTYIYVHTLVCTHIYTDIHNQSLYLREELWQTEWSLLAGHCIWLSHTPFGNCECHLASTDFSQWKADCRRIHGLWWRARLTAVLHRV